MTCETVDDCLLDYIEGQLDATDAERVRVHIETCADCRRALRETKEMLDALHVARQNQDRSDLRASASTAPPRTAVPPVTWTAGSRLGDFEIIELLGRGGMGAVYRARQVSLNRVVALKVMPSGLTQTPDALQRFRREAQAAARLHHTNIVPVYAQGEHEGHLFYAMELIDGVDLGRILKSDPSRLLSGLGANRAEFANADAPSREAGNLTDTAAGRPRADFRRLARLVAQAADALAYAHRNHVLHRDIKPQNLLLSSDGQLHITDFGLARLLDEPGVTQTGEMLGTPAYMSPEQIDADRERIDHRTDIYSLGVTLYELLTGRRPFDAPTREQTIARIRQREPLPPRKLNPSAPIDLETICLRAMEKDPRRRYTSAAEMAADLLRFADDRPILARRVGAIEKAIKWVRRHPATTTIVALVVILCAVAGMWTRQSIHARQARANELVQRAFDYLTYEDYRDPAQPLAWLVEAEPLGPDRARFDVAMGLCRLLDDTKESIRRFESALARAPDNAMIMYLLAWACRLDQRPEAFERWMQKADSLGGAGEDAAAHFFRGLALVRVNPEEAIGSLRAADRLRDPFYQAMLHLGRAWNHEMYRERKLEYFGQISDRLTAACVYRAKAAYPRYLLSIAYRIAGEIYTDTGDAASASPYLNKALELAREAQTVEPQSPRGYACEAEYWEFVGDYEKALDARDRGAAWCSTPAALGELHEYRWRLCYWLDLHERALSDLDELQRKYPATDPKYTWYRHFFPAIVLADVGQMDAALVRARAMTDERPDDFRSILSAALLLRMWDQAEESHQLLADARGRIRFDAVATADKSRALYESVYDYALGAIDWAELLERSRREKPTRALLAEAHFVAGCARLASGDREGALASFRACETTYDFDDYCYVGRLFARKLALEPTWPALIGRKRP